MLKLARLPDRTPIKLTITVNAKLNQDLQRYAALYQTTYGEEAPVSDLIPFMLETFLKSDPAFAKARKEGLPKPDGDKATASARAAKTGKSVPILSSLQPTTQPKEI